MSLDPRLPRVKLVAYLRDERDPEVLGRFVFDPAWQVRLEASQSLGKSGSAAAEPHLLRVLEAHRDDVDVTFANSALAQVGSRAAIPALIALIHHPVEDVKCSALHALGVLGDNSLTPVYLDALADRSSASKSYAMAAIHRNGDDRAIGPVVDRLHAILSRDRRRVVAPWTEVMYALDYLRRWEVDARATEAIAWVRSSRLGRLQPDERRWLESSFG